MTLETCRGLVKRRVCVFHVFKRRRPNTALEVFHLKHQNDLMRRKSLTAGAHHAVKLLYAGHVLAVCKHKEKSVNERFPLSVQ